MYTLKKREILKTISSQLKDLEKEKIKAKEKYTQLSSEFQRIARRDKKDFLNE